MDKKQTNIRLTEAERRALGMLAAALGLSVADWTSEQIAQEWEKMFPGKEYPDKKGQLKKREEEK